MCLDGAARSARRCWAIRSSTGKDDRGHSRLAQYKVMEGKLRRADIERAVERGLPAPVADQAADRHRHRRQDGPGAGADKPHQPAELHQGPRQHRQGARGAGQAARDVGDACRPRRGAATATAITASVGFFCVRTKFSGTTVHHFAFSCRTLNMGVEQLGLAVSRHAAAFEIEGPVAGTLDPEAEVDWITEVTDFDSRREPARRAAAVPRRRLRPAASVVLLRHQPRRVRQQAGRPGDARPL